MSLADSTRGGMQANQASTSNSMMSMPLTYPEDPSENGYTPDHPPSSRALGPKADTLHEEPEDEVEENHRAETTFSLPPRKASLSPLHSTHDMRFSSPAEPKPLIPDRLENDQAAPRQSIETIPTSEERLPEQHVRLVLAQLPHTRLAITNSTVYPNALGRDVLCFIISVTVKQPNAQAISWNVAKLFSAFVDLDTKIKTKAGKGRREWKALVTPLPEGRAWKDFAPGKIDQRKRALESYIQSLLVAPISDKSDFCDFLNTDRVKAMQNGVKKEGYLTKKGKSFGGWKTRYFVLDGPVMEYFESVSHHSMF